MALAAPLFYGAVEGYLNLAILLLALVLVIWALIHAALQRHDAFMAAGTLRKNTWLGILAGSLAAVVLLNLPPLSLLGLGRLAVYIGIAAAAYYLLEIRRGIKDVSEGPW